MRMLLMVAQERRYWYSRMPLYTNMQAFGVTHYSRQTHIILYIFTVTYCWKTAQKCLHGMKVLFQLWQSHEGSLSSCAKSTSYQTELDWLFTEKRRSPSRWIWSACISSAEVRFFCMACRKAFGLFHKYWGRIGVYGFVSAYHFKFVRT